MATLYGLALIVAGIFTFMPGRVMRKLLLDDNNPFNLLATRA